MITDQTLRTEERPLDQEADLFKIKGVDHIEFWLTLFYRLSEPSCLE